MQINYKDVTELSGEEISTEQMQRLCNRYYWAGTHCKGKDVLEVACGAGAGLGYLSKIAKNLAAGDISDDILKIARKHYKNRVNLSQFDACAMSFPDQSFDVILVFEAIYYFPDIEKFIKECIRILRPGGKILIVSANKDIYDFHPSPYSHSYYGVVELGNLFKQYGLETSFYGETSIKGISIKQKILRPIKKVASKLNLIPKSMHGKKWLKRLVFGKLVPMPAEINETMATYEPPIPLEAGKSDRMYKVIFCTAEIKN